MRPTKMARAALLLALLPLAGCSSEGFDAGSLGAFGLSVRDSITKGRAEHVEPPALALSAQTLAEMGGKGIAMRLTSPPVMAAMPLYAVNDDVLTYTIGGIVTLSLRDGIVVATRGFADDLMWSRAPEAARLRVGTGTFERAYGLYNGLTQVETIRATCSLASAGQEALDIGGKTVSARLVSETCADDSGRIDNLYWINARGKIVKSRQWISPQHGYAEFLTP